MGNGEFLPYFPIPASRSQIELVSTRRFYIRVGVTEALQLIPFHQIRDTSKSK
ncbi:MAG: hypothetical protein VKL59_05370 [Nostocaceae cyanobacterium]|nr:hypothetical protein [Nostocaceae cyanobacterium]